tara:strand:+ start:2826 stop:3326 length:501 start_codon:yes stop_codon:yes gene_type:complete
MGSLKHIPVCWQEDDYKNLAYVSKGGYLHPNLLDYTNEPYKTIINNDVYTLPNPMPKFIDTILEHFDFDIKAPAFNRTPPGNVLPLHSDTYEVYSKVYNVKDLDSITRYIIFLEDSQPGHLMQIENEVWSTWSAGDYVSWQGTTKHAAYNIGSKQRYTLQITCANN